MLEAKRELPGLKWLRTAVWGLLYMLESDLVPLKVSGGASLLGLPCGRPWVRAGFGNPLSPRGWGFIGTRWGIHDAGVRGFWAASMVP